MEVVHSCAKCRYPLHVVHPYDNVYHPPGCDVNTCNSEGDTPLWVACNKGNEDMVTLLLQQPGIDVNAGLSHFPLLAAAEHGCLGIVKKLLEAGCNVNTVSRWGKK